MNTGAEPRDAGSYVLYSQNAFSKVTILFYPWSRGSANPNVVPALLSRVIEASPNGRGVVLRGRIHLDCTPTDTTLSKPEEVANVVRQAYIASEFARGPLDYGEKASRSNLLKELDVVASMIEPKRKAEIVDRALRILAQDESLQQIFEEVVNQLSKDSERTRTFRRMRIERWKEIRESAPPERSFRQE